MKQSAGLLPFRPGPEVLIAHPGGPIWARRNEGAWSIVKGELMTGEAPLDAARREFTEETGWPAPTGQFVDLGTTRLRSGKLILAWGVEASELDPVTLDPEPVVATIKGRTITFPEIDRVAWVGIEEAMRLLHPAQGVFVERLVAIAT
jgi:predicted NUDIX family NTP pyrophosphohydrolase